MTIQRLHLSSLFMFKSFQSQIKTGQNVKIITRHQLQSLRTKEYSSCYVVVINQRTRFNIERDSDQGILHLNFNYLWIAFHAVPVSQLNAILCHGDVTIKGKIFNKRRSLLLFTSFSCAVCYFNEWLSLSTMTTCARWARCLYRITTVWTTALSEIEFIMLLQRYVRFRVC